MRVRRWTERARTVMLVRIDQTNNTINIYSHVKQGRSRRDRTLHETRKVGRDVADETLSAICLPTRMTLSGNAPSGMRYMTLNPK
jgi:hypothetical protein